MKGAIITMIIIGVIFAGVYGAIMVHGGEAKVSTTVYVLENNTKVQSITPGENVKIAVEVKNEGSTSFSLSGQVPVFAYANIYLDNGELKKIEEVSYTSNHVVCHVVNLNPGEKYTAYIDWSVPENVSGVVYIEAWAGSAPKANTTVMTKSTQAAGSYGSSDVYVSTDSLIYYSGNTVYITITNYGDSDAMFQAGFEVVNDAGTVVYSTLGSGYVLLHGGDSVEYQWTVPSDLQSGIYYIYSGANGESAQIYIY